MPLLADQRRRSCTCPSGARSPMSSTCIREGMTIDDAGRLLEANAERHLKAAARNGAAVSRGAARRSRRRCAFSTACSFSASTNCAYDYPDELREGFADAAGSAGSLHLGGRARALSRTASAAKSPRDSAHELRLVAQLNYAPYFLTVHDIVRFARSQGILCQGRGSAANSDDLLLPGHHRGRSRASIDLLFERFISAERDEPPDIDVDFEHERREEVMQYIYRRYRPRARRPGRRRVITYRARSAIREVGKVFGLSDDTHRRADRHDLGRWLGRAIDEKEARRVGFDPARAALRHGDRARRRTDRLSAPSVAAYRRLRHHPRSRSTKSCRSRTPRWTSAPRSNGTRTISMRSAF